MTDISLFFGGDIALDPTGDILLASDTQSTQQRVIRRLLTNAGGYIQHTDYGAGIGKFIGQPATAQRIQAVARQQMKRDRGVAAVPPPVVTVVSDPTGLYTMHVQYADQATGQPVTATGTPGN